MKRCTRPEAGYDEIFEFAMEKFGIGWNDANDVFFASDVIRYRNITDVYLDTLEANLPYLEKEVANVDKKVVSEGSRKRSQRTLQATKVLIAFMKKHKVKYMRVDGN